VVTLKFLVERNITKVAVCFLRFDRSALDTVATAKFEIISPILYRSYGTNDPDTEPSLDLDSPANESGRDSSACRSFSETPVKAA
jgi:hypothetical protein